MAARIPNYALYGDQAQPAWLDMVHIEPIHERSSLFAYEIQPHTHDGLLQLLYVTSGGGAVFVDGHDWPVDAPALIVVPAGHVHGFHFRADIDGPVVTAAQRPLESLAAVAAPELLNSIRRPRVLDVGSSPRHAAALQPLFDAIDRDSRVQDRSGLAAGVALLIALFVQVARIAAGAGEGTQAGPRSRGAVLVERFRADVDAHFHENWSVERHAQALGVSAGQLSRLCRAQLGKSALDVIDARLVHQAERELVYSTLSVKQIAGLLGFADDAYFGRFFKKQTGSTPTEFRNAAWQRLVPAETAG